MFKLLRGTAFGIAIYLVCLLLHPILAQARYDVEVRGELGVEITTKAFNDACKILAETTTYKCVKGLPPAVALSAVLGENTWGVYLRGGRTVYINERLVGPHFDVYAYGVLVHEMVHYISHWSKFGTDQCTDEQLAWDVFNSYVRNQNRHDLYMDNWKRGYPQCQTQKSTTE